MCQLLQCYVLSFQCLHYFLYLRSVFNGYAKLHSHWIQTIHYYYYLRSLWAFRIYVQITIICFLLLFYNYLIFYENKDNENENSWMCLVGIIMQYAQLVQSYSFHMHKFYLLKAYLFTKQTVFHFVFLSKKCLKKITPNCANQKNSLLFVDFVN